MSELKIRPYQADGLDFLTRVGRAALFDEPGLGKSMQSLLAMRYLEPRGRLLVVAPGDATGVWRDESRLWLEEDPGIYSGLKPDESELDRPHGIVVTNYHRFAAVLSRGISWDGIILDEAHILRNRKTDTLFKAVRPYFERQRYGLGRIPVTALSASPIVKAAGDLWPILHILNRRRWNAYWSFVQSYSIVRTDHFGWHVSGVTNAKALWAELDTVALHRTIKEVQPDLPPLIRKRVPLTMTPRQAKVYRDLEREMFAETSGGLLLTPTVLARETRLRELLASPRLLGVDDPGAAVLALRSIAREHERPIVIFTPWPSAFDFIEADLKTKRPVYRVRGGMGEGLHESVNAFKASARQKGAPILLANVGMAKSWDVSEVTYECYMVGFDWNEATMIQAERRLARNVQTSTVYSCYFVHEDSHDEAALDVLAGKKRLHDVIVERKRLMRRYH